MNITALSMMNPPCICTAHPIEQNMPLHITFTHGLLVNRPTTWTQNCSMLSKPLCYKIHEVSNISNILICEECLMYPSSIHLKQKMQEKKLHHIPSLNSLYLAQIKVENGNLPGQGCRRYAHSTNGTHQRRSRMGDLQRSAEARL